ncbi:MAG: hypothetical protein HW378_3623, partial [Anaerolineales bacterium]|nr:hypothetical protein [Anaerolineales bacterium]
MPLAGTVRARGYQNFQQRVLVFTDPQNAREE